MACACRLVSPSLSYYCSKRLFWEKTYLQKQHLKPFSLCQEVRTKIARFLCAVSYALFFNNALFYSDVRSYDHSTSGLARWEELNFIHRVHKLIMGPNICTIFIILKRKKGQEKRRVMTMSVKVDKKLFF